jgi:uncharacterized protein
MKHIERTRYTERVLLARKSSRIVLVTGLPGSGKSECLAAAMRNLRSERPPVRILQAGPETGCNDGVALRAEARALGIGPSALFIDNAENFPDLAPALSDIISSHNTTIILAARPSGSLCEILEASFAQELSVITIHPFSYCEFLESQDIADERSARDAYTVSGGLPANGLIRAGTTEGSRHARDLANSFILTEILEPNQVRNPAHIRSILELVARHSGESLPARQVCEAFTAIRQTISPQSALDYLAYCEASGILIAVPVLDLGRKKILETGPVWYFGDAGLRHAFASRSGSENLALLKLVDDGWTVYRGRIERSGIKEDITFVAERKGIRVYIQASGASTGTAERLRRRNTLLSIRDAWPKYCTDASGDGLQPLSLRDIIRDGIPQSWIFQA